MFPQVGEALAPVELMEDLPAVVRDELPPDRIAELIGKETDVEVDKRPRQDSRPGGHQISPLFPAFFAFLASFFSFNVLEGFFFGLFF